MKRIIFEDVHELSVEMLHDALNFSDCVSTICHYEIATTLLSELIQSEVPIGQINISDYECSGYDKEYIVTIMDGCIYCNPAYGVHGKYLDAFADIAYVHQDCNSMVLKHIDCDKIFEFSVNEIDDTDTYRDECKCDSDSDSDNDIVSHRSDSVTISKDKFGNPHGFTKSWSRDNGDGVTQYSSYSYYCNDKDMLSHMAQDLGIEL